MPSSLNKENSAQLVAAHSCESYCIQGTGVQITECQKDKVQFGKISAGLTPSNGQTFEIDGYTFTAVNTGTYGENEYDRNGGLAAIVTII